MSAHYSITVEPDLDLVRIKVAGFFTVEDVRALSAERVRRYPALRCAPNQHLTLCDASRLQAQAQAVVAAFAGFVREPRFLSRRLAIVAGSQLIRMQTRRVNPPDRPDVLYFDVVADAEAWLLAD